MDLEESWDYNDTEYCKNEFSSFLSTAEAITVIRWTSKWLDGMEDKHAIQNSDAPVNTPLLSLRIRS